MEFDAIRTLTLADGATKLDVAAIQDARQPSVGQPLALDQSLTLDQSLALDRVAAIKLAAAIDRMAAVKLTAETASVETASVEAVNANAAASAVAATNVAKPLAKRGLGLKSRSASTAGLGNTSANIRHTRGIH
jgi:hypothetical protein